MPMSLVKVNTRSWITLGSKEHQLVTIQTLITVFMELMVILIIILSVGSIFIVICSCQVVFPLSFPLLSFSLSLLLLFLIADLIMLGLATHEPYFTILREEFKPNQPRPCEICNQYGRLLSLPPSFIVYCHTLVHVHVHENFGCDQAMYMYMHIYFLEILHLTNICTHTKQLKIL